MGVKVNISNEELCKAVSNAPQYYDFEESETNSKLPEIAKPVDLQEYCYSCREWPDGWFILPIALMLACLVVSGLVYLVSHLVY